MPYGKPILEPPPPVPASPLAESTPQPLRFSLAQLLIGTTIAAVLLALFRAIGIWGAVLSFGAALIFTLLIYPKARPSHKQQQALMFDFVWGIVMPVVCLVFDPFVFKGTLEDDPLTSSMANFRIQPQAFVGYPILAWQLFVMAGVLVIGRPSATWAAAAAGTLFAGMFVAAAIGVILSPLSTLGLFLVIGILGYTPLFTAFSYGRRAREMWRGATAGMSIQKSLGIAAAAAVAAFAIPAGLGLGALQLTRSWT